MTKKLFKHSILPALVALLLSTTSCVADMPCLIPDDDGTDRSVTVRLAPASITTRGVSRPICHGEPVQFNQGMMYLVTSTGAISRYFPITERGGAASNLVVDGTSGLTMAGTINIACLELGKDIGLVPSTVARVVIVGNSQVALPTSGSINSIISGATGLVVSNATVNTVASQYDAFFTPGVNMFASYPLVYAGNSVWEAEMVLAPTVARFEIAKMTGMGMIHSYSVDGIFIDRYIRQATRDGNFFPNGTSYVIRDHLNSDTNFAPGAHDYIAKGTPVAGRTSGALFTSYNPVLPAAARTPYGVVARPVGTHTWGATGCLVEGCCDPGDIVPNAWSFQMFARDFVRPGTPLPHPAASTTPPVIIVRLTNVYVRTGIGSETQNIGTQYLTIAYFDRREAGGTGFLTPLTGIRASNVYHIANLVFNQDDLYIHPYPTDRTIRVEVEVSEWNGQEAPPDRFRQPNPMSVAIGCDETHTFELGHAVAGCTDEGNILYQWEYSVCRTVWNAIGVLSNANRTHTTAPLTITTYFRRVAICGCTPAKRITTMPARVTVPEVPASTIPYYMEIDGVIWATRNLDLSTPTRFAYHPFDPGQFFMWGVPIGWNATLPLGSQRWLVSAGGVVQEQTGAWTHPSDATNSANWGLASDPCRLALGGTWRLPNDTELLGLHNFVQAQPGNPFASWRDTSIGACPPGGHVVRCSTTPANWIFLPAAGWRVSNNLSNSGINGGYWSSTWSTDVYGSLWNFTSNLTTMTNNSVYVGWSVRCVKDRYLHASPAARVFDHLGGTDPTPVTVTTNVPAGWVITDSPAWLTLNATTGTVGTSSFTITALASGTAHRNGIIEIASPCGTQTAEVFVAQVGTSPPPSIEGGFVGAFWRNNERGERLIRIPNPNPGTPWTVYATEPWIQLDRELGWNFAGNEHNIDAETRRLPATAGHQVSGVGYIYFRVGLRDTNTNPTNPRNRTPGGGDGREPRWGQLVIAHQGGVHIIWARQGEDTAELMSPGDPGTNANRTTANIVTFSPFNLTGTGTFNTPASRVPQRGGQFVQFPTQTGAFWQFGGYTEAVTRMPWNPVTPGAGFNISNWNTTDIQGNWYHGPGNPNLVTDHETCPPGFRRPRDGNPWGGTTRYNNTVALIQQSEIRQSLWLNPQTTQSASFLPSPPAPPPQGPLSSNLDNSVWGFYADGFFDRRLPTNATGGAAARTVATTVAATDANQVANIGALFFNASSGASLFFPATGFRFHTTPTAGELRNVGYRAMYLTATQGDGRHATGVWRLDLRPGYRYMDGENTRAHGFAIRCVAE